MTAVVNKRHISVSLPFNLCVYMLLNLTESPLCVCRSESSLDPLVQVLEVLITSELNMIQAAPGNKQVSSDRFTVDGTFLRKKPRCKSLSFLSQTLCLWFGAVSCLNVASVWFKAALAQTPWWRFFTSSNSCTAACHCHKSQLSQSHQKGSKSDVCHIFPLWRGRRTI